MYQFIFVIIRFSHIYPSNLIGFDFVLLAYQVIAPSYVSQGNAILRVRQKIEKMYAEDPAEAKKLLENFQHKTKAIAEKITKYEVNRHQQARK